MNIWIVTIGSSDVQLDSNKINREKGRTEKQRSDKVWHYWYGDKIKANCYDIAFEPKRVYKEPDEPYRIEPRILGTVYESSSSEVRDEIWNYLTFPLLDNFTKELKTSPLDAIAVLLTDQSEIFPSDNTRGKPKCAYWQDTCTLKLILERYFKGNKGKFPDTQCLWIPLSPASGDKGLDDWNYVLDLVRHKLRDKLDSQEIQVQPNETVYVSHQAGTPAISSAVQFVSLAQFEERVQFLVSNEQDSQFTKFIESSSYLRGIQLEKAKKLLERHDYFGVKELLVPYLKSELENLAKKLLIRHSSSGLEELLAPYLNPGIENSCQILDVTSFLSTENTDGQETLLEDEDRKVIASINVIVGKIILLEAAIQWNFANFADFAEKLLLHPDENLVKEVQERTNEENWWWTAYESAYLGIVRLKQENPVEAIFHSFRAVEGLLSNWIDKDYSVKRLNGRLIICTKAGEPIQRSQNRYFNAYGKDLYHFLDRKRKIRQSDKADKDIWIFGNFVFDKRNVLFHKLGGLQDKKAVFEFWEISNDDEQEWKDRVRSCLNFIAEPKPPFTSPEEASLMSQVHNELKYVIEQYDRIILTHPLASIWQN